MGFSLHSWAFILVSVLYLCPISPPVFLKRFQTHPIPSTSFIATNYTPPIPQRKKANPTNICHSLVLSNHSPTYLSFNKPSHPLTFCLSLTLFSIHWFLHPSTYLSSCPVRSLILPSICLQTHLLIHQKMLEALFSLATAFPVLTSSAQYISSLFLCYFGSILRIHFEVGQIYLHFIGDYFLLPWLSSKLLWSIYNKYKFLLILFSTNQNKKITKYI